MIHKEIENRNIVSEQQIISPDSLKASLPLNPQDIQTVANGQQLTREVLSRKNHRLMIIVGPCSIHDPASAMEYATRLKDLSGQVEDKLLLVMRVYFEKPRTNVGWQGFINDPDINLSFDIEKGLSKSRELLLDITRLGLPVAGEALDIVTPPYIQDLISYTAIGARTVESQSHRKMASGLTSPVGFKNATNGDIQIAVNAIRSARNPHRFVSINQAGNASVIHTTGNEDTHIILRGGTKPNFSPEHIASTEAMMLKHDLLPTIIVDCSHGNSDKEPRNQTNVALNVVDQVLSGNTSIRGIMLESHLNWGKQTIPEDLNQLQYGVSITDACIDWDTTKELLLQIHKTLP
jgi:3-deoxy-7-phosphoheptulonate synthase